MEIAASIRGASKEYKTGDTVITALQPTTFDFMKKKLTLIIGPSGSGKTTLLSLMGCVIFPTTGEKHRLSFTLLSDKGNKIQKQFGVPKSLLGLLPGRVTYIADKTGKVIYIFNSQIQSTKHVEEALRILKELQ